VADELGVDIDDVMVVHGDTAVVQYGIGTFGSREPRRRRCLVLCACRFEGQAHEVRRNAAGIRQRQVTGGVCVDDRTGKSVSFTQMAVAAYHAKKLPPNTEPGLVSTHFWEPPNFTFPFGAHIVVTDVDRETARFNPPLRGGGRLRQDHQPC